MAECLLEIFGEEIPSRMLAIGERRLSAAIAGTLRDAHLAVIGEVRTYSTPRRLVAVFDLPERADDTVMEYRGPGVGAPPAAIAGFLNRSGLATIEDAETVEGKKGAYYLARVPQAGAVAGEVLARAIPDALAGVVWPKSMRWAASGRMRWVRPVRSMICLLAGEVVEFSFAGVRSGNRTLGHRVLGSPESIEVRDFADYQSKLRESGKVIIDSQERIDIIRKGLEETSGSDFTHIADNELLEEVAGLVEWPVVLRGCFDRAYLDLPEIIIRQAMRQHQKYFAVRCAKGGALAPYFLVVANQESPDDGETIVRGNERVLAARLADAKFFWDADCATGIEKMAENVRKTDFLTYPTGEQRLFFQMEHKLTDLKEIVARLGCAYTNDFPSGSDSLSCARTVQDAIPLCKADLLSLTVGEFPVLQGHVGSLLTDDGSPELSDTIKLHYQPRTPQDDVPRFNWRRIGDPLYPESGVFLALADKMNHLSVLTAVGEKPDGDTDRFGMRRTALAIVRLLYENEMYQNEILDFDNSSCFFPLDGYDGWGDSFADFPRCLKSYLGNAAAISLKNVRGDSQSQWQPQLSAEDIGDKAVSLIVERFRTWLEDGGIAEHGPIGRDVIEASFRPEFSIRQNADRIAGVHTFLAGKGGDANRCRKLIAAYKRVDNIVRRARREEGGIAIDLFSLDAESDLHACLRTQAPVSDTRPDSVRIALDTIATTFPDPIDAFMDTVRVNDAPEQLRANRLALLAAVRDAIKKVADLAKLRS